MNVPTPPTSPEFDDDSKPSTIYELLAQVALRAKLLDTEAHDLIRLQRRVDEGHELLRARARLIVRLPGILDEFKSEGGEVPAEVDGFARAYSAFAAEALEIDGTVSLSGILNPSPGALASDPNDLEKLVARLAPPDAQQAPS